MLKYYWELFKGLPGTFRESLEWWQFWGSLALAGLAFFGPELGDLLKVAPFSRWFALLPIGVLLLYGIARANYRRFESLRTEVETLRGKRNRQAIMDDLAQFRAEGVKLFALHVANDESLQEWLREQERWYVSVRVFLQEYFTDAVRSQFEFLGLLPAALIQGSLNSLHNHQRVMLNRRLEILSEIISRETAVVKS